MKNPFSEGEDRTLRPPPTALVIFGATGDLNRRKLVPALFELFRDGHLPSNFVVVGASRKEVADQDFRAMLRESVNEHAARNLSDKEWIEFANDVHYQQVRFDELDDYKKLKTRLETLSATHGGDLNFLYYLATGPEFFAEIARNLAAAGLVKSGANAHKTAVVIEKPFGHDFKSAQALNKEISNCFSEHQVFRIDHYLGKETVQNILVFRFSNGIFEPLWNHKYIDHIQVTVAESIGVGSRAGYFDNSGILRDIVQNHLLQMLSLLCIEPPCGFNADDIRDEKVKVLKSIRRITPAEVQKYSVRAQYSKGVIDGKDVCGYLEEPGVRPGSTTDTYFAWRLQIDNWRWAGVPIYVRAGKRLPKRITEITIFFKSAPDAIFRGITDAAIEQNVLSIQVQPKEGITLTMSSKPPGPKMRVHPVTMEFSYGHSFGVRSPDAYERLLLDAMKRDATLFTRDDEIEEAWELLEPIFGAWDSADAPPIYRHAAGTWGPREASELLAANGHRWRRL